MEKRMIIGRPKVTPKVEVNKPKIKTKKKEE